MKFNITKNIEMDTTTLIIGIVIAVACALPFVISNMSRKSRDKKLLGTLQSLAQSVASDIDDFEILANKAIGIDGQGKNVFFVRLDDKGVKECVDLAKVQSCSIVEKHHNSDIVPDTMGLRLVMVDGKSEVSLEFFNSDIDVTSDGESQMLAKWNAIINGKLARN